MVESRRPSLALVARTPRFVAPAHLIQARAAIADACGRIGDWEGDLIVGRNSQAAIDTLACRRSRLIRLLHLPDGRSGDHLRDALRRTLESFRWRPGGL